MGKRRWLPLVLTLPLVGLGIGDVVMQRREVANFSHEFGSVVALKRGPCVSSSQAGACWREVVEYSVDAAHRNRIVSDVAQFPAPVVGAAVEVLVNRRDRYDARIGGFSQFYLNSTVVGVLCVVFTLVGVLAAVFPKINITRQEAREGKGEWSGTIYDFKRKK